MHDLQPVYGELANGGYTLETQVVPCERLQLISVCFGGYSYDTLPAALYHSSVPGEYSSYRYLSWHSPLVDLKVVGMFPRIAGNAGYSTVGDCSMRQTETPTQGILMLMASPANDRLLFFQVSSPLCSRPPSPAF